MAAFEIARTPCTVYALEAGAGWRVGIFSNPHCPATFENQEAGCLCELAYAWVTPWSGSIADLEGRHVFQASEFLEANSAKHGLPRRLRRMVHDEGVRLARSSFPRVL